MELPVEYIQQMKRLLKDDYCLYEDSLLKPRFFGLRVNTLKTSPEEFKNKVPFNLRPVPWIKSGFYYNEEDRPAKHPYYFAGLFYIQEPSAMTPANILPVEPGDTVLDLCAAPGGKSTGIGEKLKGEGLLVSNDVSASRAKALLKNIEVFGIKNACIISEEPYNIARISKLQFDKILIDAPCSGEGMFRKDSKLIRAWKKNGPDYFGKIQRQITQQAASLLKPGGVLLYSTCTFNKYENEETVIELLKKDDSLELIDIPKEYGFYPGFTDTEDEKKYHLERAARLFPFALEGEGHFIALIQKKGEKTSEDSIKTKSNSKKKHSPSEEFFKFCDELNIKFDLENIVMFGEKIYYTPHKSISKSVSDERNLRILRNGLLLGEEKTKRFEPSQALAMALKKEDFDNILSLPPDDILVEKYIRGETLIFDKLPDTVKDGLVLFCTDGFPLGWGRLKGNTLKNKYLPGWRKA